MEDHAVGPTGFFSLVPWPEGRFALIRQPIDGPEAPEADAFVGQGKLPRVIIRGFADPLTDIAVARITQMIAWNSRATRLRGRSRHRWSLWTVVLVGATSRSSSGRVEETSRCTASMSFPPHLGDGDDYRLTPLGDGRTVLLSHTRYGEKLLVVDVVDDAVTARTALGGVSPPRWSSCRGEMRSGSVSTTSFSGLTPLG